MNKKKYIMPAVHTRIVFADDLLLTISGETTPEDSDAKGFFEEEDGSKWERPKSVWEE